MLDDYKGKSGLGIGLVELVPEKADDDETQDEMVLVWRRKSIVAAVILAGALITVCVLLALKCNGLESKLKLAARYQGKQETTISEQSSELADLRQENASLSDQLTELQEWKERAIEKYPNLDPVRAAVPYDVKAPASVTPSKKEPDNNLDPQNDNADQNAVKHPPYGGTGNF